jgi:type IV pilus assembly protein PilM
MLNRSLIAIDIGSSAVKVVELNGARQKKLGRIGLELLPTGTVVDGIVQNQEGVVEVIKGLFAKLKIRPTGRRAALALSGSSVLIKKVGIVSKGGDIRDQIDYEAEQHLEVPIDDIYYAWSLLNPRLGSDGETPVLFAGAKREMVEQYLSVVRAVGLRTGVVECGAFSVANMFEYNYGIAEGLVALVNIGASCSQVTLVSQGDYVYSRDVAIGGEEYSRRVMELLSVTHDNAEALKVSVSQGDGNVPQELHKLLGEINDQLVADIQASIDFFFQSGDPASRNTGLTSVFLTGGGSRILGLDAALAAALQIPVRIVNPFQRVEVHPRKFQMDYILMQGHLYGTAVGLGLRAMGDSE